jgi:hypothetical protein
MSLGPKACLVESQCKVVPISQFRQESAPPAPVSLGLMIDHRLVAERSDDGCGFWRFSAHNPGDVVSLHRASELTGSGGCPCAST